MTKTSAAEAFTKEYGAMGDKKKETFARLCDRLLDEQFIYLGLDGDRQDYYAILNMREAIEAYFAVIDFTLRHDDVSKIFYLESAGGRNRVRLKKLETVILIILRKFYFTRSRSADSNADISVSFEELAGEIERTGIYRAVPNRSQTVGAMRTLKRCKLINFDERSLEQRSVIEIYPTVPIVVNTSSLEYIEGILRSYAEQGEAEDEADED